MHRKIHYYIAGNNADTRIRFVSFFCAPKLAINIDLTFKKGYNTSDPIMDIGHNMTQDRYLVNASFKTMFSVIIGSLASKGSRKTSSSTNGQAI